jgi:predicted nucleic acid-binding protein
VVLFAVSDSEDKYHEVALGYFTKLSSSNFWVASFALLEFDIVLKSRGLTYDERMERYALLIKDFPAMTDKILGLHPEIFYLLSRIEKEQGLDYFDAGVAAESLENDGVVISSDREFDRVPNLKRLWK